jgi:hypothetical protein
MIPAEFEPAIPESEGPQTHTLDRTPTGIGYKKLYMSYIKSGECKDLHIT